jgi:hydroxypyruvate isomerase
LTQNATPSAALGRPARPSRSPFALGVIDADHHGVPSRPPRLIPRWRPPFKADPTVNARGTAIAMLRFAANLGMLFGEVAFLDRFRYARAAGFSGVEYPFPYAHSKDELAERLSAHGLVQVLHNLPPGDWASGERGIACQPARRGEFRDGVGLGLEYAAALGCTRLNCLAGTAHGLSHAVAFDTLVDNLRFASVELGKVGIQLLIEPINTRDMPGFFLSTSTQASALIDAVGSANLWLQYDVYHVQVMQGDLARDLERCLPRVAHIQIADNPGRHEPGTGEIHYPFVFAQLERLGYAGWVGCEYHPRTTTLAGLGWLTAYRREATSRG